MNYSFKVNNQRHVFRLNKSLASIFISILCMMLIVTANHAVAQNLQIQNSDGGVQLEVGQGAGQVSQQPDAGVQQQPQELGDIEEDEVTYFDPETVPDSVPIPVAQWVFEVPVNVQNISSEVQRLGITCLLATYGAVYGVATRTECGYVKKRVDLVDGSYQGNVVIGMNHGQDDNEGEEGYLSGEVDTTGYCDEYECKMYLIGPAPDHRWKIPVQGEVYPVWRWAAHDHPFRWATGRQRTY
jgi:hypothetical protein